MRGVEYLIIGAGISGLTFAHEKQDRDYLILEKEAAAGGLCRSFYDRGFVWDVAGHFFHFHSEKTKAFYERLMAGEPLRAVEKRAQVYYGGRYMDAPFQYNIHQLPPEEFLQCLTDLYFADCPGDDLPFDAFVRRKYGNGIAEKFLIPYNEKLYACPMNELERDSMGRFLPKLDFDTLMRFYRGSRAKTYNDAFSYPVNGCETMIRALLNRLDPSRIHLNEPVISIDPDRKTVRTPADEYRYEHLISTMPLNAFVQAAGIGGTERLRCNQVLVLNLGFDRPAVDRKVCWVYFPGDEIFYRVGFYSNIAGTDNLSLYAEIGYPAEAAVDAEAALQRTLHDLRRVGVITDHRLVASMARVVHPGYAHITAQGARFTVEVTETMRAKGVHMLGRYARWEYSAMDDAMEQAFELAETI